MEATFNFIAHSRSRDLTVSCDNVYEFMKIVFLMLAPFSHSYDPFDYKSQLYHYIRNSEKLREQIHCLVEFFKDKDPRIHQLKNYFEKDLKPDEWFYFSMNQDNSEHQNRKILNELLVISEKEKGKRIALDLTGKLNKLESKYTIKVYGPHKELIGEKNRDLRICRYCHRKPEETSYSKIAHTISEGLGNKTLETRDECDICNEEFGNGIENHLIHFLNVDRMFGEVRGKGGVPKGLDGHNYSLKRPAPGEFTLDYRHQNPEIEREGDKVKVKYDLTDDLEFPLVNVYKALSKFAMGVLDAETLQSFEQTRLWLREAPTYRQLPYIAYMRLDEIKMQPQMMVFIRKSDKEVKLPHVVVELKVANLAFVYILPFSAKDKVDFCNIDNYFNFWRFFSVYSDISEWQRKPFEDVVNRHHSVKLEFGFTEGKNVEVKALTPEEATQIDYSLHLKFREGVKDENDKSEIK